MAGALPTPLGCDALAVGWVHDDHAALGRAQDDWISQGGGLSAEFEEFAHCSAHGNYATLNIKEPPDDDAPNFVLNFSDCSAEEGKTFDDVYPALQAWSEYRSGHGSKAGMWVMWPAYGGGDAGTAARAQSEALFRSWVAAFNTEPPASVTIRPRISTYTPSAIEPERPSSTRASLALVGGRHHGWRRHRDSG